MVRWSHGIPAIVIVTRTPSLHARAVNPGAADPGLVPARCSNWRRANAGGFGTTRWPIQRYGTARNPARTKATSLPRLGRLSVWGMRRVAVSQYYSPGLKYCPRNRSTGYLAAFLATFAATAAERSRSRALTRDNR